MGVVLLVDAPAAAGYPDGSWAVGPPVEEVPPEMPEPVLGINFARDGAVWQGRVNHGSGWFRLMPWTL